MKIHVFLIWLYSVSLLPIHAEDQDMTSPRFEGYKVVRVVKAEANSPKQVMFSAGEMEGVTPNMVFHVIRHESAVGKETYPVLLARIRAVSILEHITVALIEEEYTSSNASMVAYPFVMLNDRVKPLEIKIVKSRQIAPEYLILDTELFKDKLVGIKSGELEKLKKMAESFSSLQGGKIVIEGHTSRTGDPQSNRKKSYQKALMVKYALARISTINPDDIVAIGYGEDDLHIKGSPHFGKDERNNRIMIKYLRVNESAFN